MVYSTVDTDSLEKPIRVRPVSSTDCSPFALLPQAKRRLALDDSDHQHQSEPIRTPRGKGATANGARIKAPRSKELQPAAQLHHRSTRNMPTYVQHVAVCVHTQMWKRLVSVLLKGTSEILLLS